MYCHTKPALTSYCGRVGYQRQYLHSQSVTVLYSSIQWHDLEHVTLWLTVLVPVHAMASVVIVLSALVGRFDPWLYNINYMVCMNIYVMPVTCYCSHAIEYCYIIQ